MTSPYLRSLAALALGTAPTWQARVPARFEVAGAAADDGWGEQDEWVEPAVWAEPPAEVRIDRMPSGGTQEGPSTGPPAPDRPPLADLRPPEPPVVRPVGRGHDDAAVRSELPGDHRIRDPARGRPAPVLHVTVREVADSARPQEVVEPSAVVPARADYVAPPPSPVVASPAPTFRVVRSRPADQSSTKPAPRPRPAAPVGRVSPPASPRTEPRAPARPAPVVVHIDRVDVRAVVAMPPPPPPPVEPSTACPGPDLEQYLRDGSGA